MRIIGPEHEACRKQQSRQSSGSESPFEWEQRTYQGREKNERREHGDIEPVHASPVDPI